MKVTLEVIARRYNWQPAEYHVQMARCMPPFAVFGVFATAGFNWVSEKRLEITLPEMHLYDAAVRWQRDLDKIFSPSTVVIRPPFGRDKAPRQSGYYKCWRTGSIRRIVE